MSQKRQKLQKAVLNVAKVARKIRGIQYPQHFLPFKVEERGYRGWFKPASYLKINITCVVQCMQFKRTSKCSKMSDYVGNVWSFVRTWVALPTSSSFFFSFSCLNMRIYASAGHFDPPPVMVGLKPALNLILIFSCQLLPFGIP